MSMALPCSTLSAVADNDGDNVRVAQDKIMEDPNLSREELIERLARAEERLRTVEDLLGRVPGIVFDAVGLPGEEHHRYTFVGPQVEAFLGYTVEEWMTIPNFWKRVLPPSVRDRVEAAVAAAGEDLPAKSEYRLLTKDGKSVWVEFHVDVIRNEAGAPIGVRGVGLDITARYEAERARTELLEKAQRLGEKLDGLISSVPGLVWEAWFQPDKQSFRANFASDHVKAMTGYSAEEYLAMDQGWFDLIHPDDKERMRQEGEENAARGGGASQYRWITKDGRIIWVENHMRTILDEHGTPVGLRGVAMDITERKQIELDKAEGRLREEVIRMQEARLAELSTPLIPISDEVMVMPLIGGLDGGRAERVIEALLEGVGRNRTRVAILDITGVPSVDTETADALIRAAKAVQLLGAEVVLTGIRPEVAQTLVDLGTDLSRIVTRGSLQSGIAYAIARR
jgi:anti-anti-sigma factor